MERNRISSACGIATAACLPPRDHGRVPAIGGTLLAWTREEWDVALKTPAGLGFYRIYRDRIRQQWFVEGVFD